MTDKMTSAELKDELSYYKTTQKALCEAMCEASAILENELGDWVSVEIAYLPDRMVPLKIAMLTLNEVIPPEYNDD